MKIEITADNFIKVDGRHFGFVVQRLAGTQVVRNDGGTAVELPHSRYSLCCDRPASGVPGRAQFETDLMQVIGSVPAC